MPKRIDINSPNTVLCFTDGSCYPNPHGHGGWAFLCAYQGKTATRFGYVSDATNNLTELMAIMRCLQYVPAGSKFRQPFVLYTDNEYAKNSLTKWVHSWREGGWLTSAGQPVQNRELIEETADLIAAHERHRDFELRWVRGHSGVVENELVDRLAGEARLLHKTNWTPTDLKNVTHQSASP
jgi:ribonuclease HI